MRHSKRTILTADDVDSALSLRNIEVKFCHSCSLNFLLQLYFDKITELTVTRPESIIFKEALLSLAADSGIHPLVPYFSYFIADEVKFLHQLMPSIITCVVAKRLGSRIADSHWELRDFSANLAASVCRRLDILHQM
ncbi:hypothetical protein B296_00007262 [Ensete ventricosum]|uniref:TAF6 C-terminal HEAT repeat domain-containing protein n=1 Tax=Ensete ventricosum TaxID=4639 RepID=A0A427AYJ4_ENSVE|nr:hypothetical protein B296_00007262 [Ensete ventricosum]